MRKIKHARTENSQNCLGSNIIGTVVHLLVSPTQDLCSYIWKWFRHLKTLQTMTKQPPAMAHLGVHFRHHSCPNILN